MNALDLGLWKHRGEGLQKALQVGDDGFDQDFFDAPALASCP